MTSDPSRLVPSTFDPSPETVRGGLTRLFVWYGVLTLFYPPLLYLHLHGSVFDFLLPAVPLGLIGSTRFILPLGSIGNRNARRALRAALELPLVIAVATIWFVPFVQLLVGAWLAVVLAAVAGRRFGKAAFVVAAALSAALTIGFPSILHHRFNNVGKVYTRRVLAIRFGFFPFVQTDFAVSPDGKTGAVLIGEKFARVDQVGVFRSVQDTPLNLIRFVKAGGRGESAFVPAAPLLFVSMTSGRAFEFLLSEGFPWSMAWSPDSRHVALSCMTSKETCQLWVADPGAQAGAMLYEAEQFFMWPWDAWTTDGERIRVFSFSDGTSLPLQLLVDADSGTTEIVPRSRRREPADGGEPEKAGPRLPPTAEYSPDEEWIAIPESDEDEGAVTLLRTADRQVIARIEITGGERDADLAWSPDGVRLAISRRRQTWIYNFATGRTTVIQTGRRVEQAPVAWSPDSRSIHYIRHIALSSLGLEVIQVRLRE